MSDYEKLDVYLPPELLKKVENEAVLFELYKADKTTINRNLLYGRILLGYYPIFSQRREQQLAIIHSELDGLQILDSQKELIANNIYQSFTDRTPVNEKKDLKERISIKPTRDTETVILQLMDDIKSKARLSPFICKLFLSYINESIDQREQILFTENYHKILQAIDKRRYISFITTGDSKTVHNILPCCIETGKEAAFNYVIGQEYKQDKQSLEAVSFRLSRMKKIVLQHKTGVIDPLIQDRIKRMKINGPQDAINSDERIIVELTDRGIRSYSRMPYTRPPYDNLEIVSPGVNRMFLSCSEQQAFIYFRRFGKDARVIAPEPLKRKLTNFYNDAVAVYQMKD